MGKICVVLLDVIRDQLLDGRDRIVSDRSMQVRRLLPFAAAGSFGFLAGAFFAGFFQSVRQQLLGMGGGPAVGEEGV